MAMHSRSLARLFAALSDPTRLAVIDRLDEGPASVTALAQPFDMAGPSFLKHLAVLEAAGLVSSQKTGRVRMVTLEPARLTEAQDWLASHRARWQMRLDRLGALLERTPE
ncbi:MAG: helix-turn-helix transcriptional regulator [Rhodobacter sp.]|nr:helix-turn-helix transcriptional regulator [Rhodobacter sp.]